MIEFRHISKAFDDKIVLNDISGEFEKGKVNLIIGASGTGKSVLIKCILGLIQPDQGSVAFDGRDFLGSPKSLQTTIRREIGMLFQSSALFDSKNVEENVMFPLNILTELPLDARLDRVNFCLQRVGLYNVNKKMPNELSGGMKKRVGIARAIVNHSQYLFCDEPNSGLDPRTGLLIDDLIKEITYEYNITTVVVTHDMDSVLAMGDYILFLDQGQKVWEGTSADIFHAEVKALKSFLFASKLMQMVKQKA